MPVKPKISLNCYKFTGNFAGKEKTLTRAEFIILFQLIYANGKFVANAEFPNISTQAVRVHISRLKTKLNLPNNAIISENDVGYKTNLMVYRWELIGLPEVESEVA